MPMSFFTPIFLPAPAWRALPDGDAMKANLKPTLESGIDLHAQLAAAAAFVRRHAVPTQLDEVKV